jgi:hypothetical protein
MGRQTRHSPRKVNTISETPSTRRNPSLRKKSTPVLDDEVFAKPIKK